MQTVRDQFIQDGKLVEETVWFDDLPVAVLKPKGASATSPVSGTGNVATNNQDANNTGTNGNTAPPAAPTAKVNVEVFYVHPDHLGTPRVITASTALAATTGTGITSPQTVNKAVWRWDSDPFGSSATANSAPNENPNTLSQVVGTATLPYLFGFDLAFPGQKRDRETGKHYNYFRDYDPALGRYVESDPIGLKGGLSTFGYVKQKPVKLIDPVGLKARVCCRQIPNFFTRLVSAAHCFIEEDKDDNAPAGSCGGPCESKKRRLGLQGPSPYGSSRYDDAGEKKKDDDFDAPGLSTCGEWTTRCDLSNCLDKQYERYASPSEYSGPFGPNSNTFASTLASGCGLGGAPGGFWTPGWGQPPAKPK